MTLKQTLENLAEAIATKAKNGNTPFAEAIDALKALTALYGLFSKKKVDDPDDEPGEFTMADAQSMIEEPNGASKLRSRRGRSPTQ